MHTAETDILIIGSGGAGLLAALHAKQSAPALSVTVAVKGLLGKSGCTRMVQGGYNVALAKGDSAERHFADTLTGGKWLNNQEVAWRLVTGAQTRVRELEARYGCFFDRNADGTVHQKAFAGQTFDRTVHKGDLTGIEIMNRVAEHALASGVERIEEHRAVALIKAAGGNRIAGALLIDMRTGDYRMVRAKAVLLATGGGPTMYRYHTPSGDKSCDGMAMALRAGLPLRDMEMVQFHPTGLLAGPNTRMTGTVLEEGLRGAGGWLLNSRGERFMARYDSRGERATRDIVSRAIQQEITEGRGTSMGGVYLQMSHLGADWVAQNFKGMVRRCRDCGFDLARQQIQVVPTAHYMMGGVTFEPDCRTEIPGLFAAGEDTGGTHGANRLGGNGVANSTVFGGIAGESMAEWVQGVEGFAAPDPMEVETARQLCETPMDRPAGDLEAIREELFEVMWDRVGIVRDETALAQAETDLAALDERLERTGLPDTTRAFNLTWHDWLNLKSLIRVSSAITQAARLRRESRGAHYRGDYPDMGPDEPLHYTEVRARGGRLQGAWQPVEFTRLQPQTQAKATETAT